MSHISCITGIPSRSCKCFTTIIFDLSSIPQHLFLTCQEYEFKDFQRFFFIQARVTFGSMICRKETDCKINQCCAMVAMMKSHTGFCMPAKQLGDRCAPTFIVSSSCFFLWLFSSVFSHGIYDIVFYIEK